MKKKLRAFQLSNTILTQGNSDLVRMFQDALNSLPTAQERRMKLNQQDDDEDLLAYYKWASDNNVLFGMIMRIIPAEQGGILSPDLFEQNTITIEDLDPGDETHKQYKSSYYFATNGKYLVTDLKQGISIDRLQTYINWLLESTRHDFLFEYAPVMTIPQGVKLGDLKYIEFNNGTKVPTPTNSESSEIHSKLFSITQEILDKLICDDMPNLQSMQEQQLVSAQVIIKFKKPKTMAKEEYQQYMGAVARNVTSETGFYLKDKKGNTYNGQQITKTRDVEIDETSRKHPNEEQLYQCMEQFLYDIERNNN